MEVTADGAIGETFAPVDLELPRICLCLPQVFAASGRPKARELGFFYNYFTKQLALRAPFWYSKVREERH